MSNSRSRSHTASDAWACRRTPSSESRNLAPRADMAAASRFSKTVRPSNVLVCWKVRTIPSRVRRQRGDIVTVKKHAAGRDGELPAERAEQRRLSGPVRADEPDNLTGAHPQRHVPDRLH